MITWRFFRLFITMESSTSIFRILSLAEKISEHTLYDAYKQHKLVVEIEAIRGRRKNKRFVKKIEDIVQEAKQVPY